MSQAQAPTPAGEVQPLTGGMLWFAAIMLAAANFIAVLNMTIANVAVPNIAGALGAATSQGTWVITAYAVGEAITVPLTGWLSARFGSVRVFIGSMILFGIFSVICGLSGSIGILVVARIFQGLCGGPLMPLSQTLLMRIFPKEKAAAAIGLWSMTTLVAPVVGPILGGYLCDEYSWSWVFILNAPIAFVCSFFGWNLLKCYRDTLSRAGIDTVGLVLLILWVGSLQLLLDEGKNLDWFSSNFITGLAVVASACFAAFIIWEWHEENPVVDLKVFRHRGFTVSVLTISLAFAAFFGVNVLTPLWLQNFMGYTATQAGLATAWTGVTAFFIAPMVAQAASKVDPRKLVFAGVIWMGLVTLWRTVANTDMGFWDIAVPLMVMGFALPFFFIPTTGLALSSVEEREMDSAAGLMNFLRTLSGAFATSLVTTSWDNQITRQHAELVGISDSDGSVRSLLEQGGMAADAVNQALDYLITSQAVMLATNQLMTVIGVAFLVAASVIWLAPKPTRVVEPGAGGH
ncbi:DHA2 family efflux MFS transporter permease subunit [Dechloromonas denitrificans]|uniref:DHA2 family efflux MFS transporter permease subunit n=1 Tax=Dechloromonas denitrificans TaxID=281362 RepID=UPI001CF801A4|nr:DHA2 family efflux MFS transporter permease subunit [Dechloromonas denitrificans]UCV05121.1 DHA2 family efflux MFS transporter permease subunit [Dechloromonas denitrificans]